MPAAALAKAAARNGRPRRMLGFVVVAVVAGACASLVVLLTLSVDRLNPFATHVSEGDDSVVVTKIHDLARFEAATGRFQTLVDQQRTSEVLPTWVSGERTVLAAEGDVEATVDLSQLPAGAITRSEDGKHATVRVPSPVLSEPRLDPDTTRVVGHERGIVDRLGDSVGEDQTNEVQQLEQRASDKIASAAEQSDLRDRARANTERFLRDALRSSGVEDVTVVFDADPRDAS